MPVIVTTWPPLAITHAGLARFGDKKGQCRAPAWAQCVIGARRMHVDLSRGIATTTRHRGQIGHAARGPPQDTMKKSPTRFRTPTGVNPYACGASRSARERSWPLAAWRAHRHAIISRKDTVPNGDVPERTPDPEGYVIETTPPQNDIAPKGHLSEKTPGRKVPKPNGHCAARTHQPAITGDREPSDMPVY